MKENRDASDFETSSQSEFDAVYTYLRTIYVNNEN